MSRVSIIRDDNMVTVDGRALRVDCSGLRREVQAVQWDGKRGHIEFYPDEDGDPVPNEIIRSFSEFEPIQTAWQSAADAIDNAPAPTAPKVFVASDLIDLLTARDLEAIEAAIAKSTDLRLLWVRLRARGGDRPVSVESESFVQGWAALEGVLGQERSNAIRQALNF